MRLGSAFECVAAFPQPEFDQFAEDVAPTWVDEALHATGTATMRRRRHWLIRAKHATKGKRVKRLGPDDELVELAVSSQARAHDPSLPRSWVVRVIHYQRKGYR